MSEKLVNEFYIIRDQSFYMKLFGDRVVEIDEGEENYILINLENIDDFIKALQDFRDVCEKEKK